MAQLIYTLMIVLNFTRTVSGLIAYTQAVLAKMTGNTSFPTPTPSLATVSAALTAYQSAVSSTVTTKGLAGLRAAKRAALIGLLKQLGVYVITIAEADIANSVAIVESAGMALKKHVLRVIAPFTVVQGALSGTALCTVKSVGRKGVYYWAFSVDQKNWTEAPDSVKCKVTISGLTPGQTYYFRSHTMTAKGTSDFSQIVTLLVK
jgi:hypothetical protein